MKYCNKCGEWKELKLFGKNKNRKDGLTFCCKDCIIKYKKENEKKIEKYQKEYREKNKKKFAERDKKHYEANKDKILKQKKEYYQDNKDKIIKYRKNNAEVIKEKEKIYREKNPHITINKAARRRALIGNKEITKQDWLITMEATDWKCFYCHEKLTNETRTIDHFVPLNRGGAHCIENLVPACKSCNSSKQDKLYHEWIKTS